MKKIILLVIVIAALLNVSYTASTPVYKGKEVDTVAEMIAWIKNEAFDVFQGGRYANSMLQLKNGGEILVVDHSVPDSIVVATNGSMIYYGLFDDPAVILSVKKTDYAMLDVKIQEYLSKEYPNAKIQNIKNNAELADGENISYVVYQETVSKHSRYKAVLFLKNGFEIKIIFDDEEYAKDQIDDLNFKLVSLDEPIELPYTDVSKSDWFYEDVGCSIYIPGTTETTFSPNMPADRVTIASALYNVNGKRYSSYVPDFVDVDKGNPGADAVGWAQQCGIVNGVGDNKFDPEGNVTRQDFAVMLWRYMKYRKFEFPAIEDAKVFADDGEIADYAKEAVKTLNVLGIMNGRGNDIIDPKGNVTRAEAAAMLRRMMNCL